MPEPIDFKTRNLADLPSQDKSYEVAERGRTGLRVRVGTHGTKSFRWVCSARGKAYTLGEFDGTEKSIKLAREKLALYKKRHEAHLDPEGTSSGERPKTVEQLADLFYSEEIAPSRKRPEVVKDVIERDIKPTIGKVPLDVIDTVTAGEPARAAVRRKAKVHASKVLQITKQMFAFGANNGYVSISPAASLKSKSVGAKGAAKGKRWMREEEIVAFWRALDQSGIDAITRLGLRLLLLTALRTNELITLRWDDVDFERKTLTVRAERRKLSPEKAEEAGDWVQPLSAQALEDFKVLRALCPTDQPAVFYSPKSKSLMIDNHTLAKAMKRLWASNAGLQDVLAKLVERAKVDPSLRDMKGKKVVPSPHDFRRSVATHLGQNLKLDPVVRQLVLGHSINKIVESGVADTYDRGDAMDERRAALDRWAAWIMEKVSPTGTGAKVIPIAAR